MSCLNLEYREYGDVDAEVALYGALSAGITNLQKLIENGKAEPRLFGDDPAEVAERLASYVDEIKLLSSIIVVH